MSTKDNYFTNHKNSNISETVQDYYTEATGCKVTITAEIQ